MLYWHFHFHLFIIRGYLIVPGFVVVAHFLHMKNKKSESKSEFYRMKYRIFLDSVDKKKNKIMKE